MGGARLHLVTLMDAAILIRDLKPFRQNPAGLGPHRRDDLAGGDEGQGGRHPGSTTPAAYGGELESIGAWTLAKSWLARCLAARQFLGVEATERGIRNPRWHFSVGASLVLPRLCRFPSRDEPKSRNYGPFRGGPDRTRTCDLRFRKPLLYPAELRDRVVVSVACVPVGLLASPSMEAPPSRAAPIPFITPRSGRRQ